MESEPETVGNRYVARIILQLGEGYTLMLKNEIIDLATDYADSNK